MTLTGDEKIDIKTEKPPTEVLGETSRRDSSSLISHPVESSRKDETKRLKSWSEKFSRKLSLIGKDESPVISPRVLEFVNDKTADNSKNRPKLTSQDQNDHKLRALLKKYAIKNRNSLEFTQLIQKLVQNKKYNALQSNNFKCDLILKSFVRRLRKN